MTKCKMAVAGLLLAAGAYVAGGFLGNQLLDAVERPEREVDAAVNAALATFQASDKERFAALAASDSQRLEGTFRKIEELRQAYDDDVARAEVAAKQLSRKVDRQVDDIIQAREELVRSIRDAASVSKTLAVDSRLRVQKLEASRAP
jgi:hypothetical protein